ncbi:MAG TPA: MFS transporter [Jiangellales bacterium]|nr:MFS transporter [Jiangellales bacterium]
MLPPADGPEPARVAAAGTSVLALATVAVLVSSADTYVVVLALPEIMVGVGLDVTELQRAAPVISVFLLGFVAMLPLLGRLADLVGRPPVLVGSLVVFAAGSLVTAVAGDLVTVVVGRFLQGVGSGGILPVTLALVADLYPVRRRGLPLGVVGAVQELGTVVGPLVGAVVLAVADWRAIFWLNLGLGLVVATGLVLLGRRGGPRTSAAGRSTGSWRHDLLGAVLLAGAVATAVLGLVRPEALDSSVRWGVLWVPLLPDRAATAPVTLLAAALLAGWVARELTARRPGVDLRRVPALARAVDLPGALLAATALGGVVLAFATADATVELVSPRAPLYLGVAALAALGLALRQRRAADPVLPLDRLRHPAAWGAMLVSLLMGAALIATMVQVPVYARTALTGETQLDAALELMRFLVGMPVGALLGGWLVRHRSGAALAGAGMGLAAAGLLHTTTWDLGTIDGRTDDLVLLVAGLGFGLAIAPVNAALLAATPSSVHGRATALLVLARTIGKLVGLSALTALGLRAFYRAQADVPSPGLLCPTTPLDCPPYAEALQRTVLAQVHASLAGAAACAALAAVLALLLLRGRSGEAHDAPSTPGSASVPP